MYRHYHGFATSQLKDVLGEPVVTAKKVLCVLRIALTGAHVLLTGELNANLAEFAPMHGFGDALALIEAGDAPAGRWVVTASTALDAVTHLEWILHPPNMTYLWSDASSYCAGLPANLSSASAKAWRLPHVKELFALWNEKAKGEEPSVFGAPPQLNYYWADELYRYAPGQVNTGGHHYRVTFDPMDRRIFWENNQDFAKARCVRDAP